MNGNTVESALHAGHVSASRAEQLLSRLFEAIEGAGVARETSEARVAVAAPPGLSASAHDLSCRINAIADRIEGALSLLANPAPAIGLGNGQALGGQAVNAGFIPNGRFG